MAFGEHIVVGAKFAFVEGAMEDYAVYVGPNHWPPQLVARAGQKLTKAEVDDLLPIIMRTFTNIHELDRWKTLTYQD